MRKSIFNRKVDFKWKMSILNIDIWDICVQNGEICAENTISSEYDVPRRSRFNLQYTIRSENQHHFNAHIRREMRIIAGGFE
jgi:hypothetical protein